MYKTFAISLDESTSIMCCPRHGDTSDGYKWDVTLYKNHRITDSWAFTTESEARAKAAALEANIRAAAHARGCALMVS